MSQYHCIENRFSLTKKITMENLTIDIISATIYEHK